VVILYVKVVIVGGSIRIYSRHVVCVPDRLINNVCKKLNALDIVTLSAISCRFTQYPDKCVINDYRRTNSKM
jgi:hypothetical protein